MRIDACSECDEHVNINSDHERWCPKRQRPYSQRNPDGSIPNNCKVCGVDHVWASADLSHGIIRLLLHAQERATWMEWPINGDMIARQRAGILNTSLLFSWADPEEIDWERISADK